MHLPQISSSPVSHRLLSAVHKYVFLSGVYGIHILSKSTLFPFSHGSDLASFTSAYLLYTDASRHMIYDTNSVVESYEDISLGNFPFLQHCMNPVRHLDVKPKACKEVWNAVQSLSIYRKPQ